MEITQVTQKSPSVWVLTLADGRSYEIDRTCVLEYALLSAPGAPLKKALTDAGIGKDIMGSYDNGVYQPIFSVVAKNAEESQKDEFVKVIEDVLRDQVKNGINQKALLAGINYDKKTKKHTCVVEKIQK